MTLFSFLLWFTLAVGQDINYCDKVSFSLYKRNAWRVGYFPSPVDLCNGLLESTQCCPMGGAEQKFSHCQLNFFDSRMTVHFSPCGTFLCSEIAADQLHLSSFCLLFLVDSPRTVKIQVIPDFRCFQVYQPHGLVLTASDATESQPSWTHPNPFHCC